MGLKLHLGTKFRSNSDCEPFKITPLESPYKPIKLNSLKYTMREEKSKILPSRALMLAQMGKKKESRDDHDQRINLVHSLVKKTPTPRKTPKIERVTPQSTPVNTPRKPPPGPPVHTPQSQRAPPGPPIGTPPSHQPPPGPPVSTPPSVQAPPKKVTPPRKRIRTTYTPMDWTRDYRHEVLQDLVGARGDQENENNGVKDVSNGVKNVSNDSKTHISVTSLQGSEKKSELSVTVTNKDSCSYTLNVLHSTLGERNVEMVTQTHQERPETGDPSEEATWPQSPQLFSELDNQIQSPNEVMHGSPWNDITEEANTEAVTNTATDNKTETENADNITTENNKETSENDTNGNAEETEDISENRPHASDLFSSVINNDQGSSLNSSGDIDPGQSNASSKRQGPANRKTRQTIEVRKNRKRKIEEAELGQNRSEKPETIKRNFKNKVRTIATGGHELHRKAKKAPNYLILIEDSVHSKKEIRPRVTAGKILTFGEGQLARQFLQGQLKFSREKYFFNKNPFDTEEKLDFSDLFESLDASHSDNDRSIGESSAASSEGNKSNLSSTSSDNGCFQRSKQSKKDSKKEEQKAKKAKANKESQERNSLLSKIDITDSLPPVKRKSAAAKKNTKASKKTSNRKKK